MIVRIVLLLAAAQVRERRVRDVQQRRGNAFTGDICDGQQTIGFAGVGKAREYIVKISSYGIGWTGGKGHLQPRNLRWLGGK